VVRKVVDGLNDESKSPRGSRVLVLGVAYKPDVADLRESPALEIMRQLQQKGAVVTFHDPHCDAIEDDGHTPLAGLPMRSVALTDETLRSADAVVIVADHGSVDYARVGALARLIVDTRGAMRGVLSTGRVVGLSALPGQVLMAAD
jgi:UDP-N-acetyl-D-glucosamine dehydrogenase